MSGSQSFRGFFDPPSLWQILTFIVSVSPLVWARRNAIQGHVHVNAHIFYLKMWCTYARFLIMIKKDNCARINPILAKLHRQPFFYYMHRDSPGKSNATELLKGLEICGRCKASMNVEKIQENVYAEVNRRRFVKNLFDDMGHICVNMLLSYDSPRYSQTI